MGNPTNIVYRSMWERKFMKYCDQSANVLRWASEEIAIPYISPLDKKAHRYYVDFLVEIRQPEGIKTWLIEIKPKRQCMEPKKRKRVTTGYITEVRTWIVNNAKWNAAKTVCDQKGWEFKILTEDELFKNKT